MKKIAVLGAVGILSFALGSSALAADFTGKYTYGLARHHIGRINAIGCMREYCSNYALSDGVCQMAETCVTGCPNGYTLAEKVCRYDGGNGSLQNGGGNGSLQNGEGYGNVNGTGNANGNQGNGGSGNSNGNGYGIGNGCGTGGYGHHTGGHGRGCRR